MELTVLVYNIWDGGDGRLDALASVIGSQEPDVVALLEATSESASALAGELGLELAFGQSNSIFDLHVAWLSRLPVRRAQNHRLPALAKTLLEIDLDGTRLFATHLTSRHEETAHPRDGEIRAILDVLGSYDEPHLLVGDFNALQPDDPIGAPPPGIEKRGEAAPGAARVVLPPLATAGYADCFRALHRYEPGFTYPARAPWLRLDYVFASPAMTAGLRECDVVTTNEARKASDHLPVVARFS